MRIALLDDNPSDVALLYSYLLRFQEETGESMVVKTYHAGLDLLEEYGEGFDTVFLDIEMPGMNGMEVAREIRKVDTAVGIIFITNMAQYALKGYEVNAIDFMVKPVGYFNFSTKLGRAMQFFRRREERFLALSNSDGVYRVPVSRILWVEKSGNYVCYHTMSGEFTQRDTIRGAKTLLEPLSFSESTSGCLVNLRHVEQIGKDTVLISGNEIPLSRRMKKKFTCDFMEYLGGVN